MAPRVTPVWAPQEINVRVREQLLPGGGVQCADYKNRIFFRLLRFGDTFAGRMDSLLF